MSRVELYMWRRGFKLVPYGSMAEDQFEYISSNEPLLVTIRQARNPDHHNKLWAILTKAAQFDPTFDNAEAVLMWLKLKIPEMHSAYRVEGNRTVVVVKSTSFASMDQIAFKKFYDQAIELLSVRLGCDPETLLDDRTRTA